MMKPWNFFAMVLAGLLGASAAFAQTESADNQDLAACMQEIGRVCMHLEDQLKTCLDQRGGQMSSHCREELSQAIALAQAPNGPSVCIPDIKRLCPDATAQTLGSCVMEKQSQLSQACQTYLQSANQKQEAPAP